MLTLHDSTATTFSTNGLGVLDPHTIEATIIEELGGQYQLSVSYPADGPLAGALVLEAIIAAPVPGMTGRQGFRIHEVATNLDGILEVTAFHVFYDGSANFIADTFVVNKTAKDALDQILGAATTPHSFTATSSAATRSTARIVRMPVASALMDGSVDNTFASRWGGEITRDNWHIHHAMRRGADHGVVIRDRKNLTGYQSSIDLTTVVTRIVPVGYDGITLPELYVDSPRVEAFTLPRIRVIRYPNIKAIKNPDRPGEDEVPLEKAHDLLREAARAEYATNLIDQPTATYKVSFVELSTTAEYQDFSGLETVNLGDTVTVRHGGLGVALTARVVGYDYDPLAMSYRSVELGSVASTFTSVTRTVNTALATAQTANDLAGVALASADGKTTNHYGTAQPATARLGDTWFKTNGEQVEIWIYQITDTGQPGWVAVVTDVNHAQVRAELDKARAEVETAITAAANATQAAEAASAKIDSLDTELDQTRTQVAQASQVAGRSAEQAQEALTAAEQATLAGHAATEAGQKAAAEAAVALSEAKKATTAAASAATAGKNAASLADQARQDAASAQTTANKAVSEAAATATALDAYKLTVTDSLAGVASQITQLGTDLNLRVTKDGIISQINLSPETVLIAGQRVHITGQTTIDTGIITSAMIKDAAITNAKIVSLDAAKITTGYLNAGRIRAGSITSDKLTIANGFITSAMIKDAAITNAKIASLDAAKITSGYLNAARISAGSITADKLTIAPANLAYNPTFASNKHGWTRIGSDTWTLENGTGWAGNTALTFTHTTTGQGGAYTGVAAYRFALAMNRSYRLSVWVKSSVDLPPTSVYVGIQVVSSTGVNSSNIRWLSQTLTADTWTEISHVFTVGANWVAGAIRFGYAETIPNPTVVSFSQPMAVEAAGAELIVNGSITGIHVKAGSITSDKLTIANGYITSAMIKDAAITNAKIGSVDAGKINTGTLAAARIAAGSITSDKLTIANGYITSAMIKDAAITNAKIAALDAAKITTGTLSAARIGAKSITADKLATNAIQVGLAGWTSSIRISPTQIAWYDGSTLEGTLTSNGMRFYYGTRYVGEMARRAKKDAPTVQGIVNQLSYQGDYVSWTYQSVSGGDYYTYLTLDPRGKFYGSAGIHFGANLRLNGYRLYTSGNRYVTLADCAIGTIGTFAGFTGSNAGARVVFANSALILVTGNTYYNMSSVMARVKELITRINSLIGLLNKGWITTITDKGGGQITWSRYNTTGLTTMSTTIS